MRTGIRLLSGGLVVSVEHSDGQLNLQLGALWGKSAGKAGGRPNLLISHLLDTAAVAEHIWDHYLAPRTRSWLDRVAGGVGRGRGFFSWLCGMHDCGKATPAFQSMDDAGAAAVRRAGLGWSPRMLEKGRWRHDRAGGRLVREVLATAGWDGEQIEWVWPLIAGHHGLFPPLAGLRPPKAGLGHHQGKDQQWARVQDALVQIFTEELGFDAPSAVEPHRVPTRAQQLHLSGLIVMADWIASNEQHFKGINDLPSISLARARDRASAAWSALGLRGGWGMRPVPEPTFFQDRFDEPPRESQMLVMQVARQMPQPGLMIVEAPMGEGKTKAALGAAEIVGARFGADGVFVGMPTQATADPMFTQVRKWVERIEPGLGAEVALLHGKRRFNKEWQSLLEDAGQTPDDLYGTIEEDVQYGMGPVELCDEPERRAPAEWFLGAKRGLLTPFVVGTIDQLLFAATRTKHVMLRVAGLTGKVVVLDEVHAADVYMSQFLAEGLWWLGQARTPVVLLSATLPPGQRQTLVKAYLAGAASREDVPDVAIPEPQGYPNVTAAWHGEPEPKVLVRSTSSWRADLAVGIEVLAETEQATTAQGRGESPGTAAVAELLDTRLREGGCALVIRNTVDRAQETYQALRRRFGQDVRLLHGRLHAAHRAGRTEQALDLLGPRAGGAGDRPRPRLILVATQLAEQSFDVDVDLLITDLAPVDLLLQRIGRLHRHAQVPRPAPIRAPRVVITGFAPVERQEPSFIVGSEAIYGRYLLLRTAALLETQPTKWSIPSQVPELVARVYGDDVGWIPQTWRSAERKAYARWAKVQQQRAENAQPFLLSRFGEHERPTLAGVHIGASKEGLGDEKFQALVRDGEPSIEAILVRHDGARFSTLQGRRIAVTGEEPPPELLDELLGATVRLPSSLTRSAEQELSLLDGWRDHPWLRHSRALIIPESGIATVGEAQVSYDESLGLVVRRNRTR
ncbi:CRISPR-associated helicase Cas3' [Actinomadura darangshiensis]|uniref:CRISPR-associated helicase Cas3 n=1 Tax=Actinomadura darangshiensis TaxID=705336 RepID=A0A4R5B163_9ACTN|nr:CRISPR-associated helicase Cas3' [Actinomadura darangshiensis]TDD77886.1 CRISPR-associated helicase Cas3' [Actinomadura darangshiensis]